MVKKGRAFSPLLRSLHLYKLHQIMDQSITLFLCGRTTLLYYYSHKYFSAQSLLQKDFSKYVIKKNMCIYAFNYIVNDDWTDVFLTLSILKNCSIKAIFYTAVTSMAGIENEATLRQNGVS